MSDSREAGLNQEQRTKNQELPKTPAVLHGRGFSLSRAFLCVLAWSHIRPVNPSCWNSTFTILYSTFCGAAATRPLTP